MNLHETRISTGVNTETVDKILKFINENERPYTPFEISKGCKLGYYSTRKALKFLEAYGKVEVISNGRTWLIRKKSQQGETLAK